MSSVSGGATVIVDKDGGDAVTVTGSRLDVNAYLSATPTIDIGDVSLLLGGTAASVNNGSADATTLRVTVADDSTGVLSIDDNGGSLTVDSTYFASINNNGANLLTIFKTEDSVHSSGDYGLPILAVRNDAPTTLSGADGDYSVLQVSAEGALYVEQLVHGLLDTFAMIDVDNAAELLSDTIGIINDCAEIMLQADEGNTGYVIIGDADVADNRGMKLNPGDTLILDIDDTRIVNLWGSADNQNVRCMITRRAT